MKTIRRPISILLAVLMVVGMFTMVPISAGAAPADFSSDTKTIFVTDSQGWDGEGAMNVDYWKVVTTGYDSQWNPITEHVDGARVEMTYLYDNTLGQSVYGATIPDDANWVKFTLASHGSSDTTQVYDGSWWYIDENSNTQLATASAYDTTEQTGSLSAAFVTNTGADEYYKLDGNYYFVSPTDGKIYKYENTGDLMVAQAGNGVYSSVNEAVAAAGENGEVKLIADIKGNVGIDGDYTTTLDLNGKTITNTSGSGITLYSKYNGDKTFTIKDTSENQTGAITINKKYTGDGCISDSSGRKVVIEGGTYTSDGNALYVSSDNGWTINGGTFNGDIKVISALDVTGGTINGDINATGPSWTPDPAEVTISGGTVTGSLNSENESTFAVSGGTFSEPVPAAFCADGYIPTDDGQGHYGVKQGSYVAKIGDTGYETLAEAIAAAQTGDTVKLVADVTEKVIISGKDFTLDLNGFNITSTTKNQPIDARDGTKLVITNTNEDKAENTATQNAIMGPSGGNNYGSLIARGEGTEVVINAGYYYGYNGNKTAIHAINDATIIINDCTVNGAQGIGDTTAGKEGKVFYSGVSNPTNPYATSPGTIIVHGGNFSGRMSDSNWGNYIIDGGTFDRNEVVLNENPVDENGNRVATASSSMATLPNSPGTLDEAGWLADGYKVVANTDGTYGVAPKDYVAQIGETKYESLGAAFAAVQDGETITLLANSTGGGIKVLKDKFPNGVTLDFAGYTYTIDSALVGSPGYESQAFHLEKGNTFTFKNGTITSENAKMLVQNYSDLTLDGMTLTPNNPTYTNYYTLSNNNGNIVIKDTTINANPTANSFAFDVCRYSSYPSVNVTVTGNSVINGDVEISASKGDAKDGFSLTLESGTMTGDIVVDASAQALVGNDNKVTKANTFTQEAPEGYEWVDNGDGTSTLGHVHDWDYENVTWTFTENASHSIYAKYTLTCKTDPTHTKEQTGSGTLMSTVAVDGDKFVYSHSNVKIDGNSVAVPNYTRNIADGIINQYELKAAVKVAGEYKLANDITGFYDNVKPVDSFVLDGQDHMIKYGTMNASGRVMFVAADQNTKFTLKNITLDGNNRAKWAVCAYTGNSGNNAGNVITLDTVTIQNFKSNDYVGAINAFGSSTWNLKDCTITGNTTVDDSDGLSGSAVWAGSKATININGGTYDEVYLHSYSGTGAVLNADGGATIDNLVLDLTKTDTLKANIDDATVSAITSNEGTIPEEAVVMDPDKATVAAPEGYKWVDSDETGMKTLAQIVYVAQIGETKYETLEEAFAAAVDGDTITVLADCAGNGIKVTPAGKFATGLTVDFDSHTYTVDGETVGSPGTETLAFQLLKNNKVTFKNGTIYSEKAKMLVQNYCNLTLDNMKLTLNNPTYNGAYTLSNNNGDVVINNTTINANPTTGSFAFDVCRYGKKNTYPSVNVTVTGESKINGNVEIFASNNDPKDGFSLNLVSGTMTGDIIVTPSAAAAMAAAPDKASVNKKNTFEQAPAEGYKWKDNGDGTSTLVKIPNLFTGNGLALHGDIGVIFYLNPEAAGFSLNQVNSVSVDFACDKYSGTVTEFTKDAATGYIKVAYYVPVAYMASDIIASNVKINGLPAIGTDTYSVQKYALDTINDPNAPDARKTLMKEMLNYGAKAKAVFESQMQAPDKAVYKEIPDYTKTTVTAEMIEDAIEGEATDMSTVTPEAGAVFYGSSVIYLSETTLRMVFAIPDGSGSKLPENAYTGHQGKWYHWVDKKNIPAAELHKQQTFTVGNATFNYSALDYAKAVLNSNMDQKNKDLVSAMYLYNQAAIACFA